jgi:perosamine synthetase
MELIPVNEPLMSGNESKYIQECIDSGWISSAGKYIDRFETDWADYCGRKYGIAVSNGTVALELAVSALNLPRGSEVIMPSFTIVSCLEAVLRNGLTPVLVDCDPRAFCMSVDETRNKINDKTSAIMPVHIYGHPVNMEPILKLAMEHNLKIVEDAAEAHGSECLVNGRWIRCGSFGDVSAFSFYANKNITCGEGGIVLTNNDAIAELLRNRRSLCFGRHERFRHEDRGWNFRMTNMQAAIGCAQLEKIDDFIKRKLEMAAKYDEGLQGLPLKIPYVETWARSSVWMYAILLDDSLQFDAAEFAIQLKKLGIETRPFFVGMHEQPVYRSMGYFLNDTFPITEKISRKGLYLPSGQAITDEQIRSVIKAIWMILS